jgi:hypothetical protein
MQKLLTKLTFRMSAQVAEEITRRAQRIGVSPSQYVRHVVEATLQGAPPQLVEAEVRETSLFALLFLEKAMSAFLEEKPGLEKMLRDAVHEEVALILGKPPKVRPAPEPDPTPRVETRKELVERLTRKPR